MMKKSRRGKRRRGVRLSSQGWERLQMAEVQQAARDNDRQPYTLEALTEITGLSINTLTKVRSGKTPVDRQTIADYFEAFGLALNPEDYVHPEALADDSPASVTPVAIAHAKVDWGEAPDVELFYGRELELTTLERWVVTDHCRLIALLGFGGMGKTALAAKFSHRLVNRIDRLDTAARPSHVIWRSLRNAPPLDTLLSDLIPFVSDQQDTAAQLSRLLYWLRQRRCIVVLDNAETILLGGDRTGYYRPGYEAYGDLFRLVAETSHRSCVILTSREKPAEVGVFEGPGATVRTLQLSGSVEAARALVDVSGLVGTEAEKQQLCDRYSCSPLALKLIANSIQSLFNGEIALFLNQDTFIFNGIRRLIDRQFERLSPLEHTIMVWLAINREWTSVTELVDDVLPTVSSAKILESLESLTWRSLLETQSGYYTQQPVVMEYVIEKLVEKVTTELVTTELDWLLRHTLVKTTVSDYLRDSQIRLILQPIANQFGQTFGAEAALEQQILRLLTVLRRTETQLAGYGCGNLINLCGYLGMDLAHYDFSNLTIRHAYLPKAKLSHVNFSYANFSDGVFTQTFSSILSLAFSPDDQFLAAGDSNGEVRVWNTADNQPRFTVQGHMDWVVAVAFDPTGERVASGGDDTVIHLWETATGQSLMTLHGHTHYIQAIAFHPDGRLASGSHDTTIRFWNIQSGVAEQTLQGHTGPVRAVAFSPDGQYLASGSSDRTVKLWDAATGNCLATLVGHAGRIWAIAWHPDGQTLVSGSSDTTIRVWDIATQTCYQTLKGHSHAVLALDFSADGRILGSSSSGQTVKLWNVESGNCLRTMREHQDWVWALAFSQDGRLATGGDDQTLKFWDGQTGQCLKTLRGFTNQIFSVDFHPHKPLLASGGVDGIARIWDWQTGETVVELSGHTLWVRITQFSPDGRILATGSTDKTIRLWDVTAIAQLLKKNTATILQRHSNSVRSLSWRPDSQQLASSSNDCTIRVWNVSTGNCIQVLQGHSKSVREVAWHPTLPIIASGGDDKTVRLWDVETGETLQVLTGHHKWLHSVAWHPEGQVLASSSADQTIRLWDGQKGDLLQVLAGHASQVQCIVFSPTQPLLASASGDFTIKIWNIETGIAIQTLVGHKNQVQAVAFSPDGQILASTSNDGTIKLWQCETGECVRSLQPPRPYEGMDLTGVRGLTSAQVATLQALGAVTRTSH